MNAGGRHQPRLQIAGRLANDDRLCDVLAERRSYRQETYTPSSRKTYLSSDLIRLDANKVHSIVKVHRPELSFLDHPMVKLALEIHHKVEHVIVGFSWKENLASVEFV